MFWWQNKKLDALEQVSLPGQVGTVSIPKYFATEYENDSTLLAYPKGQECISLRFTSLSFAKRDGSEDGGKDYVRVESIDKNIPLIEYPDKVSISYEEESTEESTPLLMKYWEVGSKNTILIISACIIRDHRFDRRVWRTLSLMPDIIRSVTITKSYRTIEDDGQHVEVTVQTVDPTPQKIETFSFSDEEWRNANLLVAKQLSSKYGIANFTTPDELDAIFSSWMHHPGPKESAHEIANALGAAFGEYLVVQHDFQWVVVEDEYGSEYAVRNDIGETIAFPRASVQKRIEDGIDGFFRNIYVIVCDQLDRAEKSGRDEM